MTSLDDIVRNWRGDYVWYNTGLNPIKAGPYAGWSCIRTFPLREKIEMVTNYYVQAGLTLRAIPWENMEIGTDDYIEDFYLRGREEELLTPSHFQGLFLLMGILISTALVIALWELLNNQSF